MLRFGFVVIVMLLAAEGLAGQGLAVRPQRPDASGVIAGRVTIDGKPAAGVAVLASPDYEAADKRATTDRDGRFRITGLRSGSYSISAFTPGFFPKASASYSPAINLDQGEIVDDVDFALERGGVITGRVMDKAGHALIEEPVTVGRITGDGAEFLRLDFETDDRGVYRIYGLALGRYVVAIGCDGRESDLTRRCYPRTYHPGVTSAREATALQVGSGAEVSGADIVVSERAPTFKATGRVVDDQDRPVSNVRLNYGLLDEDGDMEVRHGSNPDWLSGREGQFELVNLAAGGYWLCALRGSPDSSYSDLLKFEVRDGDVRGLQLIVHAAASVSGTVVLDSAPTPQARERLSRLGVDALEGDEDHLDDPSFDPTWVRPDGSFTIRGIKPGKIRIQLCGQAAQWFRLLRIERGGIEQPDEIDVRPNETLTGIRVVVAYETGVIKGSVVVPPGTPRP